MIFRGSPLNNLGFFWFGEDIGALLAFDSIWTRLLLVTLLVIYSLFFSSNCPICSQKCPSYCQIPAAVWCSLVLRSFSVLKTLLLVLSCFLFVSFNLISCLLVHSYAFSPTILLPYFVSCLSFLAKFCALGLLLEAIFGEHYWRDLDTKLWCLFFQAKFDFCCCCYR